ncbi:DNA-binding transcriptional LysR family regulator [Micromonospora pisi]|uniref:DNA-binding transcriptional LysR family regulator n=1 Tax=Micromonospora pisi TaxID=589240 RepID=A0A495JNK8_9ACTN|nr:LysR family transcriptional regulator [Micromonospora pisi]RKR90421.1 DNA-binding transcriptional LysR family regulator [Micromonospora pisi]
MLDVRRMQLLHAVVTSGSVTAAARDLGYTPSAVSQQITVLEKEAGIALLERTGRGVRATDAGRLLNDYAAAIGEQVAEAETALADLRAGRTGRLAVRYFATAGASLVAPAVALFRHAHPGVRVDLRLGEPEESLPELKQGRADLAIVVQPPGLTRAGGIRFTHLLDDNYLAVLPRGHRLAGKRVLDLSDLAEETWVGSEWPGPCLDAVLDACDSAGFRPDFAVQSEDYATAQGFVAAGLGVSLVPELGVGARHPAVVVRKVRNPVPTRVIYAAVRESSPAHPALPTLLNALHTIATPLPSPPPVRG